MPHKMKPCPCCQCDEFEAVPDSLASYCVRCGFVWVGTGDNIRPGVSLQKWVADLHELKKEQDATDGAAKTDL